MIKAVILDVDDTLIEYFEFGYWIHSEAAKRVGLRAPSKEKFGDILGIPWDQTIKILWPGIKDEEIKSFKQACREIRHVKERKQIKGSAETIKKLKDTGYHLGVLTGRERKTLFQLMEKANLPSEMFDFIHAAEDNDAHKPDPMVFSNAVKLLERKGVKKDEILYVGDSRIDAIAAKKAGLKFLGVCTGPLKKKDFEQMNELCIGSVKELPECIPNL